MHEMRTLRGCYMNVMTIKHAQNQLNYYKIIKNSKLKRVEFSIKV